MNIKVIFGINTGQLCAVLPYDDDPSLRHGIKKKKQKKETKIDEIKKRYNNNKE